MKKLILAALSCIVFHPTFSQEDDTQLRVLRDAKGIVKSVEFGSTVESPPNATAFFREYLELTPKDSFREVLHKSTKINEKHERYDQYYNDIPVAGAGYTLHFINGKLTFVQGHFVRIDNISTSPAISSRDAAVVLSRHLDIPVDSVNGHKGELIIKDVDTEKEGHGVPRLVYQIRLFSDHVSNTRFGYVDAASGEVLATEPIFVHTAATGTFATRYSGSRQAITESIGGTFRLEDLTRGAPIRTWNMNGGTNIQSRSHVTDNNNTWTTTEHGPSENDMGLDVHWGLQQIYDHLDSYGIDSYDDNGFDIDAYIRFGNTQQLRDNAGWNQLDNYLTFGDGDVDFRPMASLDVVGHEFGHGITDFQMGWSYTGNGAVFHEGISDIWGAIFEYRIKGSSSNNWRMGEQVALGFSSERNIQNTNDSGARTKIADTFQSSQYNGGNNYVKSGVFSHWFYILVNGESGTNDLSDSYDVVGIGIDKAEEIMLYAIFNNYLDFTGTYPDVRTAMINVAIAKYCNDSPEVAAVTDAWYAVGVGAAFGGSVPSITGTEPICTSQNFSVQNQIAGTTRFWWSGNTSRMTVSPQSAATTTATRVNNYNGSVDLNLTLVGTGGCATDITESVQVGSFNTSQITVTGQYAVCPGNLYLYTANIPGGHRAGYSYQWTKPSNWTVNFQSTNTISYYVPMYNPNYGPVEVSVNNGCGASSYTGITAYPGCGGGFYFAAYPNPSSTTLTVELRQEDPETIGLIDVKTEYTAELISDSGTKILSAESKNGRLSVNTERYPSGLYYLRLILNDYEAITERLVIE